MKNQRHKAREIAVSTLYSLDFNSELPPSSIKLFASYLINGTIEHLDEIDELISKYSTNRPINKIDYVDRNILRISFFQLMHDKDTHPTIIIDEAVKLSQALSNDVSFKFINGILDTYAKATK